MLCSRDVSGLLTEISTCDGHIPTGSSVSQILAFYAHFNMFEEINHVAIESGLIMTCYVDDITISGKAINRDLLYKIRGILKSRGLISHPSKEHIYLDSTPREVTGSIVDMNGLRLPNRKHQNIHCEIASLARTNDDADKLKKIEQIIGKVIAGTQADFRVGIKLDSLKHERNRLRKLLKSSPNTYEPSKVNKQK